MDTITLGTYGLGLLKYKMKRADLASHVYIVGSTGMGKSQFMAYLAYQLVKLEQGVCVVDPHGDLANLILSMTGSRRNLIWVEPSRPEYALPWNVLLTENSPAMIADNVIEAFKRAWTSLSVAPQFEEVIRNSLHLLVEHKQSILDIRRLLLDGQYRHKLVASSQNANVRLFFEQSFSPQIIASTRNKIDPLIHNPVFQAMLGADSNVLELRTIMDEGKILLVNLAGLSTENRNLLGAMMMTFLEQAARSRTDTAEELRRPFYIMVDEFQSFVASGAGAALEDMLSEVRKMRVSLILAHQGIHQIDSSRLSGALKQAHTKVVFRVDHETATAMGKEIFMPSFDKQAGSVTAQRQQFVQQLQTLPKRRILLKPPHRMTTVLLKTVTVPGKVFPPDKLEVLKKTVTPALKVKPLDAIPSLDLERFYG